MEIPQEWQTPEAQKALDDALKRAIRHSLAGIGSGALRGCTIDELHHLGQRKASQRPRGLPRGAELARRVKLAQQGDKLAKLEVEMTMAKARTRHEPVARGLGVEITHRASRPPQTRYHEFVAAWITLEVEAHAEIKAGGGSTCNNRCRNLTNEAAYERAAELFATKYAGPHRPRSATAVAMSKAHAKRIFLKRRRSLP